VNSFFATVDTFPGFTISVHALTSREQHGRGFEREFFRSEIKSTFRSLHVYCSWQALIQDGVFNDRL
jgi:hypothetical protein